MFSISLTQEQANQLLFELKVLAEKYDLKISANSINKLELNTKNKDKLVMTCTYRTKMNMHINIHEKSTGISLIRLNLDNKFHKNLNGEIIRNYRVNIFDLSEYCPKKGHFAYMKAYKLPYKKLNRPTNFVFAIMEVLNFTNTDFYEKLKVEMEENTI